MRVASCCLSLLLLLVIVSCEKQQQPPPPKEADKCDIAPGPNVCPIVSNGCDYDIDKGTTTDIRLDHKKKETVHFHSKKLFTVRIAPDTSGDPHCLQGCDTCPFQDGSNCVAANTKNVVLGRLTDTDPGHSCRYTVTIDQSTKDPNLIIH